MFRTQGPWLGQVRLVSRPALGSKATVPWDQQQPHPGAKPPEGKSGCLFLGGVWSRPSVIDPMEPMSSEQTVEHSIRRAKAAGYSIHETDAPPCMEQVYKDTALDPAVGTITLYERPVMVPCPPDRNFIVKYVWGCPKEQSALEPTGTVTQTLPAGPKPDLVPVAAGAGVVAIVAAVIAGAFGK